MAMERDFILHDIFTKSITALGCNSSRREIYLGFEDGCVKSFELDSGKPINTYSGHKGWITCFLFWSQSKILFSASNDCVICALGSGGNLLDKIFIGIPVYSMGLNNKRREIILGVNNGIQFHQLNETREGFAHLIDPRPNCIVREHTDIVRCLSVQDSRIYTAGYDGTLCIYECHFTGKQSAVKCYKNTRAHDAGISCLSVDKDSAENQVWIFTGSFDKSLKLWTGDGKLIHRFEGFLTGVTGLCYVPKNKTVCCVAGGTNQAFIYDPKSGEEITEFIDTFKQDIQDNVNFNLLKFLPEYNIMMASTTRRQLYLYKYNNMGPLTCLKYRQTLDSICYTSKSPILVFTGDSMGNVVKWEQKHSNQVVYTQETLLKSEFAERESSKIQGPMKALKDRLNQNSVTNNNNNNNKIRSVNGGSSISKRTNIILRLLYLESSDLIFGACEDASIYVWG
jgi:WD40 repeat protein